MEPRYFVVYLNIIERVNNMRNKRFERSDAGWIKPDPHATLITTNPYYTQACMPPAQYTDIRSRDSLWYAEYIALCVV